MIQDAGKRWVEGHGYVSEQDTATDGTIFCAGPPKQVITPAVIEAAYHTPVPVQLHPVSGKPYILMP